MDDNRIAKVIAAPCDSTEFCTKEVALSKARFLKRQGWEIYCYTQPPAAIRGFVAAYGEEKYKAYEWADFDEPLVSGAVDVSPEEMILHLDDNRPDCIYDSPKEFKMGFIWYRPEDGVSIIRFTKKEDIENSAPEIKSSIMEHRNRLIHAFKIEADNFDKLISSTELN